MVASTGTTHAGPVAIFHVDSGPRLGAAFQVEADGPQFAESRSCGVSVSPAGVTFAFLTPIEARSESAM
eukprot:CAMPEP_0196736540 /NCGR_PEP_ID=MMETSP1091-20130531/14568_1 /TAXON_ID=302021 /ORGANISM="Rhodomonas sp., Strain CCMP768" /LENGTH=68 /DNA_ID=CAMNT_0042080287 /DNA_START=90 /DNA_END=299 /DNA_ORIENTATION=-